MDSYHGKENTALKAGVWYVVSNVMVKAITVITTPIFTRLMSTEEYGTFQTFVSWYNLLLPIFTLNLTYSIGRAKLDFPDKLDNYLGSMQFLSAAFSCVLSILILLLIRPVTVVLELSSFEAIILVTYLFFSSSILLYQNGYRYRYKYKQNIAIAWYTAFSTSIVSLILIFAFNKYSKADMRMLGTAIPTIILSLFFFGKSIKNKLLKVNIRYWKYGLQISLPLILHTVSMHILSQSDRIIITKIWGKTNTAFYSLAYTYGILLGVFTTAVGDGWLPWFHDAFFAKKYEEIKRNVKPLVVLGCYIGLACIAFAPEAIYILGGSKYERSVFCVGPIALGVVCQYIYTHYVNIELHLKKTMFVSAGTIFAALFNIITNVIFIPKFGYIAAAYTTLVSYFALMLIHFFITRKVLHVKLYNDLFMFASLLVTALIAGVLMLTYQNKVIRYLFIIVGFGSFLIYFRKYLQNWIKMRKKQ